MSNEGDQDYKPYPLPDNAHLISKVGNPQTPDGRPVSLGSMITDPAAREAFIKHLNPDKFFQEVEGTLKTDEEREAYDMIKNLHTTMLEEDPVYEMGPRLSSITTELSRKLGHILKPTEGKPVDDKLAKKYTAAIALLDKHLGIDPAIRHYQILKDIFNIDIQKGVVIDPKEHFPFREKRIDPERNKFLLQPVSVIGERMNLLHAQVLKVPQSEDPRGEIARRMGQVDAEYNVCLEIATAQAQEKTKTDVVRTKDFIRVVNDRHFTMLGLKDMFTGKKKWPAPMFKSNLPRLNSMLASLGLPEITTAEALADMEKSAQDRGLNKYAAEDFAMVQALNNYSMDDKLTVIDRTNASSIVRSLSDRTDTDVDWAAAEIINGHKEYVRDDEDDETRNDFYSDWDSERVGQL